MVKVIVLMSTYNGQDYLEEQIESILSQKGVDVKLYIRDDGSSDNTVQIAEKNEQVTVIKGNNIGVGPSFMTLLLDCPKADYYAFADQDDIWDENKLISAVNLLKENKEKPTLYVGNQRSIDKEANFIENRFDSSFPKQTLLNVLFMNLYSGCTMVMNNLLKEQLCDSKKCPPLSFFNHRIHDAWIACVALTVGIIIYDENPHMSFRRHGNNQTDAEIVRNKKMNIRTNARLLRSKLKRVIKGKSRKIRGVELTAKYLLKGYGYSLTDEEKLVLTYAEKYRKMIKFRKKLLLGDIFKKYAPEKNTDLKLKVLLNIL